jgi:hypothetical protein
MTFPKDTVEVDRKEYEALKHLKHLTEIQGMYIEAAQVWGLENDIDKPIRLCVAMLALLGCDLAWSCCGFDYMEQPKHKSHAYGEPYIMMKCTERAIALCKQITDSCNPYPHLANSWRVKSRDVYGEEMLSLWCDIEKGNSWPDKSMIHYSEPGAIAIGYLEQYLSTLFYECTDKVWLRDYNHVYKTRFEHWQYPAQEPWLVTRQWVEEQLAKRGDHGNP